ncbi:class I-like SAM-binding methyltransferase super [Ancistrocladus abbreviatus]
MKPMSLLLQFSPPHYQLSTLYFVVVFSVLQLQTTVEGDGELGKGVACDCLAITRSGSDAIVIDKGVDFANYFCTLAFLYHQKRDAFWPRSGILAIWSTQVGTRKVYAVEATKMCEHYCELLKANNLETVVEVIEGSMEDVSVFLMADWSYVSTFACWLTAALVEGLKIEFMLDYLYPPQTCSFFFLNSCPRNLILDPGSGAQVSVDALWCVRDDAGKGKNKDSFDERWPVERVDKRNGRSSPELQLS